MNVYIIAHGDTCIGMGHVMRCLALAEAFRDIGHKVCFYSKYMQGAEKIRQKGFEVTGYKNADGIASQRADTFHYGTAGELFTDIKEIMNSIQETQDVIIVDSYNVTYGFFENLKVKTRCLAYIDDINAFPYPVDILINGSAGAEEMQYGHTDSAKKLLGLNYNLVRREFRRIPKKQVRECIKDVFISTGNSDPYNVTGKIIKFFINNDIFSNLRYHVIIGGGFDKAIWKDPIIKDHTSVLLYEQPVNMADIMLKCDIAVTAGGSTLYELASCGIPMIVFSYAENQQPQIQALKKRGLIQYIGSYQELREERLIDYMEYLEVFHIRKMLAIQLQLLVDGKGGERVAREIEKWLD
jgi:UDP-2,4-diacetamido-2,4,6-trideoxy-beta-L-altropyranose hydrolase